MHGGLEYVELHSKDLAESRTFFERLFGWKFGNTMGPDYQMFKDANGTMGGGISGEVPAWPATGDGQVNFYVTVDSIDKTLALAEETGGKTLKGKTLIDESIGWWASFADPSGNAIGIHEPAS